MTKWKSRILFSILLFFVSAFLLTFSENPSQSSDSLHPSPTNAPDTNRTSAVKSSAILSDTSGQNLSDQNSLEGDQKYQVVKVVDGDTFDVNIDGQTQKVRVIGIDTPETVDPRKSVQCFGKEASNKAKEILTNQFVSLEADQTQGDRDKYGRLLRYAFLPDGTNYGLYMISEGYAHEYTYRFPYKYQTEFKQAELAARQNNKGLWSPNTCSGLP